MRCSEIMDILLAKKAQLSPIPAGPSKRIISAAMVPVDAQANDIALDESAFMSIPQAPSPTAFEDVNVGLEHAHADNSYVLGPGPLDPAMPQQHFAAPSSFGAAAGAAPDFTPAFSEPGPSTTGGNGDGVGQAQDGNGSSEDDDESSESSSESDDSDSD